MFVLFNKSGNPLLMSCMDCRIGLYWSLHSIRFTNKCEEPQTPSPGRPDSRRRTKQPESVCRKRNKPDSTENSNLSRLTGFGNLLWRNRKPFKRVARKREELDILSPLYHVQQWHSYIKHFIYLINSYIRVFATIDSLFLVFSPFFPPSWYQKKKKIAIFFLIRISHRKTTRVNSIVWGFLGTQ